MKVNNCVTRWENPPTDELQCYLLGTQRLLCLIVFKLVNIYML